MVIDDHIDLLGKFPWETMTTTPELRTPRALATPYDTELVDLALSISRQHQFVAHRGVYAAVTGPNYETRAEYSYLRRIGADAVGMSTVPEVQVAHRLGMQILGLSTITNVAHIESPETVDALHVVDAAQRAEPKVRMIVEGVVKSLRGLESQ